MKVLFQRKKIILGLLLLFLFVLNYPVINTAINSDFFGIVFSVVLFLIGGRKTNFPVPYFLVFLILIFEFVSFRLHTKSLHFLSLMVLVCLVYYSITKKFSFIAFISILLFSTLFNKFFEHLTTEIKQALCNNVYLTLKNIMEIERVEGVNFYINNAIVTVDTACMGLSMFKTGLLTGAFLLTFEEKKHAKYYSIFSIVFFSCIIIVFNIISNYFRILILILLNCTQENFIHHSIGVLCFVLYQILPMFLLIRFFKPSKSVLFSNLIVPKYLPLLFSFIVVFITSLEMKNIENTDLFYKLQPKYTINKGNWVTNEVFKIETNEILIYIKTPSHKPLICWTGDGYQILHSEIISVQNETIWYNEMSKNKEKFYSYWWYECGDKKYTSFIEVMFVKLIQNKPIRLINEVSKKKLY